MEDRNINVENARENDQLDVDLEMLEPENYIDPMVCDLIDDVDPMANDPIEDNNLILHEIIFNDYDFTEDSNKLLNALKLAI